MFFYATRTDKDGHRLMTSYGNAASQKKYGGADAKLFNGVVVRNLESGEFAELEDPSKYDFENEELIRSRMFNANPEHAKGKFLIRYKDGTGWHDSEFRMNSYGAANSIMKAIIPLYAELIIVEDVESVSAQSTDMPF